MPYLQVTRSELRLEHQFISMRPSTVCTTSHHGTKQTLSARRELFSF
jgi:hypothetical protein